ncbi:hypothetical protein B0I35DRAFT_370957 [Stachybotrys elegans]|uniref:PAS domain-containing protein n=1 Tax=Stachybotrys elegans TaxID=80388 RepID=A0A8K0STF9_9HYPO|nr:hypothetical protein B0I35DRAFT_370957 [Stachybotrys elegans]
MPHTHSRDKHHRDSRTHSRKKGVHALSAFDASGDSGSEPAAAPSIPLGSHDGAACLIEQIAFDPAFRNQELPKGKSKMQNMYPLPGPRSSSMKPLTSKESHQWALPRHDGDAASLDAGSELQIRPRSSSTISNSATSVHSRSFTPSRVLSSTASSHEPSILPGLQVTDQDGLKPLTEEEFDPASFDLVVPVNPTVKPYSLETQSKLLFSIKHLAVIFQDPSLLQRFTNFLHAFRPRSVPLLLYYLDAVKALQAIEYASALSANLDVIPGLDFTADKVTDITAQALREKADKAFETMANNDLPAFITQTYIQTVSVTVKRRIANTLPPQLREQSEGLAEVFCLTDPSRPDNPIVFASEEFHRTTQYGMNHVLGRNCRFLQGPNTNPFSVKRIREKLDAGQEHCETFLNYRRDGSPFMNLLMLAPLLDSRGVVRYHIGAQVDVSGLVKSCAGLESLARLMDQENNNQADKTRYEKEQPIKEKDTADEFRRLAEKFSLSELKTVRDSGGLLYRTQQEDVTYAESVHNWHRPRLLISDDATIERRDSDPILQTLDVNTNGRLSGVYENYLLIRPYPNLRVLFASPSLRVPGMLQSHFMDRIGGSSMVRDTIAQAFAEGNGITAKVRWTTRRTDEDRGRPRWIHCTPLLGLNETVGVWMVVLVDEESDAFGRSQRKEAPPVRYPVNQKSMEDDQMSLGNFAEAHRAYDEYE